ncbi:hypothetical protein [Devosia sp. A449]
MSNALGISPSVMINRMVDRAGTPLAAQLAKVAELRMELMLAVDDDQQQAASASPTGEAPAVALSSGAVVDRLI